MRRCRGFWVLPLFLLACLSFGQENVKPTPGNENQPQPPQKEIKKKFKYDGSSLKLPLQLPQITKKEEDVFRADGNHENFVSACDGYKAACKTFREQVKRMESTSNKALKRDLERYVKRLTNQKKACYSEAESLLVQKQEDVRRLESRKRMNIQIQNEIDKCERDKDIIYYLIMRAEEVGGKAFKEYIAPKKTSKPEADKPDKPEKTEKPEKHKKKKQRQASN